jgi:hypothetical protein
MAGLYGNAPPVLCPCGVCRLTLVGEHGFCCAGGLILFFICVVCLGALFDSKK